MAEKIRFLGSWIEVAPALLICPKKTSTSPELETITEEWELEGEGNDQKSAKLKIYFSSVLILLVSCF